MFSKKHFICCLLVCVTTVTHASALIDSNLINRIKELTTQLGKKVAPDKRTAIFNVQVLETPTATVELETTIPSAVAALRSEFQKAGLNVIVQPKLLPAAELGTQLYGVVRLSVANNRKEPAHSAEMMTQMLMGTPVELLKKERGYALVRSPDQYISWVETAALAIMDANDLQSWKNAQKLVYTADYGFTYAAPNEKSQRVSDVVNGAIFKVLGKEKGFYKIQYADQRLAYVPVQTAADYQNWVKRPNPKATAILNTAKTLIGVPYLWGGTSVKGVDCSGFTKTSYFLNGIVIPRDASQQALVGTPVDVLEADTLNLQKALKNLQPGDLLFFAAAKGKTPNARITHTAIYMGNGQFIQSAGMVRINSIDASAADYDAYNTKTLVSARRMLDAIGTPQIQRMDQHEFYTNLKP
ncbi:NlpC/P60 family protein [Pedobacter sp.]|uniref:C40 family peptidase n=1 Tax=Pedobacter sp. TaxID=1411316 RepID=UPI003D7FFB8B